MDLYIDETLDVGSTSVPDSSTAGGADGLDNSARVLPAVRHLGGSLGHAPAVESTPTSSGPVTYFRARQVMPTSTSPRPTCQAGEAPVFAYANGRGQEPVAPVAGVHDARARRHGVRRGDERDGPRGSPAVSLSACSACRGAFADSNHQYSLVVLVKDIGDPEPARNPVIEHFDAEDIALRLARRTILDPLEHHCRDEVLFVLA